MTVRWTVRAANDRSRVARQESNPVISSKPLKLQVSRGFSLFLIILSDYILFYTFFMKGCGLIMRSKIVFRGQSEKLFSDVCPPSDNL